MDPITAALGVVQGALDLAREAKTATKEQHDAIMARLAKTDADLQDSLAAARAARSSESAETQAAIDKARGGA